jgi:hypothetical protein
MNIIHKQVALLTTKARSLLLSGTKARVLQEPVVKTVL